MGQVINSIYCESRLRQNIFCSLLLSLLLLPKIDYAQNYKVSISAFSGSGYYTPQTYYVTGPFGTLHSATSTFNTPSVPTSFSVDFFSSQLGSTCTRSGTVSTISICGGTGTWSSNTGSCGAGGSYATITLAATPILTTSGPASGTYCEDQKITLTASPYFGLKTWYYRIQSGTWTAFSTNNNINYTFGLQDVFGSSYTSYLNQTIYFGYGINGCGFGIAVAHSYVFAPHPVVVSSYSTVQPTCNGGSDGSVTVTLANLLGGESVVTNLYSNNTLDQNNAPNSTNEYQSNGTTVNNILAGTYYTLIESSYGNCGLPTFTPITVPPGPRAPLSASASVTSNYNGYSVTCPGASNGQITVTASGGNGSFQYSLDGGSYQASNVFTTASAGNHSVKVRDGCSTPTTATTNTVSLSQPSGISISSVSVGACNTGNTGQITISASGGAGTLSYSINGGAYQSSNVFTGLAQGSYPVMVRDLNGCSVLGGTGIVPGSISAGTISIVQPTCSGSLKGTISISGSSGGTGALSWSLGGAFQSVSSPFTNVSPGIYAITVRDANGCTVSAGSKTINQPITASYNSTLASCATVNDGTITVTAASGGAGSFQYSLNAGAYQSNNVFTNLSSGSTYSINVKDGNGCVFTISNASVGLKPSVAGAITQTSFINCYGQTTAGFNVVASGGTSPYTSYNWSNGATGTSVSNIGTGVYTVTITDSKGCQGTSAITITQPAQLIASLAPGNFNGYNVSCRSGSNGSINLTPAGGTSPYSYAWSTGAVTQNVSGLPAANYNVTVADNNGCTVPASLTLTEPTTSVSVALQTKNNISCFGANNGSITISGSGGVGALSYSLDATNFQLSPTFSSLAPSSYAISAKDVNGCLASTSSISITTPTALSITSIIKSNPLCYGAPSGSLNISANGGTTPYSFSVDGINFGSTGVFPSLSAGSYIITVRDAQNCAVSSSLQVLSDPALLTAFGTTSPQSCAAIVDGMINVSASGGTSPLMYSINGIAFQASPVFASLASGIYTVTIKDSNNCIKVISANVGVVPAMSGTITQTSFINCFGQSTGALSLVVSGGNSPYTIAWSNGATTQNISSLNSGNYSVVITDAKNCSASNNLLVTQPTVLSVSLTGSNYNGLGVSCATSSDGFINSTANGGTSPYTYSWSNGASSKNISALPAGNYSVLVKDSKNCTVSQPLTITAPAALSLGTFSQTNVTCNGGNDGSVTVVALGGTGTYLYSINSGSTWQSSSIFSLLSSGPHVILAKDQNSCSTGLITNFTQPQPLSINIGAIQNSGCGLSNGSIQSSASGGTGSLSFRWTNSSNQIVATSANLTGAPSGVYLLTVTDQVSCSKTTTATISNPSAPTFSLTNIVGASCYNSTDGGATASISSGLSPFSITWGNSETGNTASHLPTGSNTILVRDANNCATANNFNIPAPSAVVLNSEVLSSPSCPGGSDGSIQIKANGGAAPYSYSWNGNAGSSSLQNLSAGDYALAIKDVNNCLFTKIFTVIDFPAIGINVINQVSPTCASSSDGAMIVQAVGGTGPYNYLWNAGTIGSQLNSAAAGVYTVTVLDSKNCSLAKQITLTAPPPVSVSLNPTSVSCFSGNDGAIAVTASGGTGIFNYSYNNGNTWQTQTSFNNLTTGDYTLFARDQNGCLASATTSIAEPTAVSISVIETINPTCGLANGFVSVNTSGGTGSYSYQWLNSLNQSACTIPNLQNAVADNYTLKVTDANLCLATATVTMPQYPSAQFNTTSIGSTSCSYSSDGAATLQIVSAKTPYSILWSTGETSLTANKLIAGQNTVSITDSAGCVFSKQILIPSPQPITLTSEIINNPVCVGSPGSIQVLANGGTGTLSYSWDGTAGANRLQNSKSGTYALMVNDGKGCSLTKSYTLTDPPPFIINLGPDETICPNTNTQIGLTLPGATYLWSGPNDFSSTQGIISVSQAGLYRLLVTNINGCEGSDEIALTVSNNLLRADFLMASVASVGDSVIAIDISWPLPDKIQWHLDGATILNANEDYALITYNTPGTYRVGVTASLTGCEDSYYQQMNINEKKTDSDGRASAEPSVLNFTIYPNPFTVVTNFHVEFEDELAFTLKVYSLASNRLIMSHEFFGQSNYLGELDFAGGESGLYIVVLQVGSTAKAVRIIKL